MDDLVTWLRAQLAEDERAARAWLPFGNPTDADRDHIARHDPVRMLADVDAKRRILDLHAPVNGYDPNGPVCSTCGEPGNLGDETAVVRWPCPTVRLVVLPYADRAGYQAEWRP